MKQKQLPKCPTTGGLAKRPPRPHSKMSAEKKMANVISRIERRARDKDYIATREALVAKRASESKGRFGRGESVLDQFVTHGVVEADRQYHGCANVRDDMDDGDIDAWKMAD